ncbi:MAG: metalloregulator ArsR/SmtB family transcription factor [Desulfobacteraceae bacterium]|jgi:ArsR family transcriptional regulator
MNSLTYFKALSDSTRIRIYNVLLDHELSVNELVTLLDMGQSRVSHHVKILADAGLLTCRRSGVWSFYSAEKGQAIAGFSEAVRSLFKEESSLGDDLKTAVKIIGERSVTTRQFFNTIAPQWDSLKKEILGSFDINQAISGNLEGFNVAADLGCGTGELMSYLKNKAGRVIGVDSSQKMLEEARKRFSRQSGYVDLRLGELEHLPMKDGEADLAVISLALHHLSEPQFAVKEASRVLTKGGTLIVAELEQHANETLRKNYGDRWLGLSKEDVSDWLVQCGFKLGTVTSHNLHKSLVLHIYTSKNNS